MSEQKPQAGENQRDAFSEWLLSPDYRIICRLLENICIIAAVALSLMGQFDMAIIMLVWAAYNKVARLESMIEQEVIRSTSARERKKQEAPSDA